MNNIFPFSPNFFWQDLELWGGDFYTDEFDDLLAALGPQLIRFALNIQRL
jgi:hypothetical protein